MSQNIKDIIREEYIKCAQDPAHFMRKYTFIQHPQRGRIIFNLFPFQEKVLHLWKENPYSMVLKSRQLGISTLAAGYSLWLMLFHKDKNILCLATTQETAKNMVTKVKFMFDNLPSWLKIPSEEHNKLTLKLNNGSQIKAKSSSSDAARSEAVSLLIIDEAAFIENIAETWTAAQQTLACIEENSIIYTPNGLYRIKDLYNSPKEGFNELKIPIFDRNNNIQYTSHFYKSPRSNTFKIKFKDGNYIITTEEHPLLNNKEEWVQTKNLKPGDKIKCYYNHNIFGTQINYSEFEYYSPNAKLWNINNIDMAYLVGLWVAEGSYRKNGINISNGDKDITNWLENIGFTYGGRVNYTLNRSYVYHLFKQFLKIPSGASNKLVPSKILSSSKEEQIAFLQGCFDGDGCSHSKGISYCSISEQLVHDIHIMLLNFGIKSTIREVFWKKNKLVSNDSQGYRLDINKENSKKFYSLIGFRLKRKQNNLDKIKNIKDWGGVNLNIDKNIIINLIKNSNFSLSKWNKKFTNIEGFLWRDNHNISKQAVEDLLKNTNKELFEYKILEKKSNELNHLYNNEIISIEEHNNIITYDLKVPINTSFIANNIVNHNTGGGAIVLSTPYGTGNWFHQTWVKAENQENDFLPIKLPWFVHPERNEEWRKKQDELLGDPRLAAQECDCDFSTSGDTVFHSEWIEFISQTTVKEPLEKRGVDQNFWVWEPADYSRDYLVVSDVARGDGKDYSTFHVIDIITNTQVAEYRGQLSTKEFGYFLVGVATEYNNALLIIENASIGWATIDAVIERGYRNLYQSPKSDQFTAESYLRTYEGSSDMTPGFTMSMRTRPLIVNKFREFVGDRSVTINSKRLVEEMKVFIWKNGRPEAQAGYNDDLVMPFGIAMYLRDTSLKFQQQSQDMIRATLGSMTKSTYIGAYNPGGIQNPYNIKTDKGMEDISWLL